MNVTLDISSTADYQRFLKIKSLPQYRFVGRSAWFPDEYASLVGVKPPRKSAKTFTASDFLFDYQAGIARLAAMKRRFSIFADCGLGKTLMIFEFLRAALADLPKRQCVLIVSPLMVIRQTLAEKQKFYGDSLEIEQVAAADLQAWLKKGGRAGITNYEAIRPELDRGRLGGLILDESSLLKSHYGKWGTKLIEMGRGLAWKLACTGTPAPNDRIEYANHAVFMDAFPTVNSFLARFFVNRGQTQERWELKPHALEPFYRALSHWSIFVTNPATYGWKDNCESIPPIHTHIHDVPMTAAQDDAVRKLTGKLFVTETGGICQRSTLGQIAKGSYHGEKIMTGKPAFVRSLVDGWETEESTIIWCLYNREQQELEEYFPGAASLHGETPHEERERAIEDFKARRSTVLISKPKILGYGLNLQVATRQVFSGLQDSYESYYQAVKRSNRVGSKLPLNVHIPVAEIERPMVDTVLRKAAMVQRDTEEQERIFKKYGVLGESLA